MARRSTPRRVAATSAALLGLFLALTDPVHAALAGQAQNTSAQSASSATYAVVPTVVTTGIPLPLPADLTFTAATPRAFYDAVNTGTIDLVAAAYGLTMTYVGTGTPTITLVSCAGGSWNQTLNTCSGTQVTLGSWAAGSTDLTASSQVPGSPDDRLRLRATVTTTGVMVSATAIANVSVSSGPTRQVRAAVTTHS